MREAEVNCGVSEQVSNEIPQLYVKAILGRVTLGFCGVWTGENICTLEYYPISTFRHFTESFKTSLYPQWKRPTEQLIEQQQKGHRVKESTNLNLGRIKRSVVDICCLYFGRLVGRFENSQKSISFKFHRWVVSLVVVASGTPSGGWLRKRSIQFIIHLKLCDAFYEQHKHRPATGFLMSWVSRWCRVWRRNNYCLTEQSCNQFKVSNTVRCL